MVTAIIEEEIDEDSQDTMEDLYIIFFIDGREYGIEIRYLIEIIAFQPVTFVPNLPKYVKGVLNLRGKIIPVLDVRTRFGMPSIDYTENTCILILNFNNLSASLIVDGVKEVLKITKDNIEPSPGFEEANVERFVDSIGKSGDKYQKRELIYFYQINSLCYIVIFIIE